ncbi:CHAT domain-containing protein [Bradyrhizobium sp. WSM 1738]|uniref:CHAT domain-containing protein n=1 Tax=Bradyrhizobium hereditatis TaxID=2821405 RepID=UPI001CE283FA|nr:CHAT domain-containing protein [Bradyrhizobium hereditatis]MCA6115209.1 CHAT domain-containing protein [Bradyrhizobium hereditatis]
MPSADPFPVVATVELIGDRWIWRIDCGPDGEAIDFQSGPVDDVRDASRDMNDSLRALVDVVKGWSDLSEVARAEHVNALKQRGRRLAGAFFDGRQDEFARYLGLLTSPVLTQYTYGRSEQPLFEHCLLNDGNGEFFLGERCICRYRVINAKRADLRKHYEAAQRAGPRLVGYAEDSSLDSACRMHNRPDPARSEEEISILTDLAGGKDRLSVLDALTESLSDAELEVLRNWIAEKNHVLHFNCHTDQSLEFPRLRLRSGAKIGILEMTHPVRAADFRGTLVFLNASSSVIGRSSLKTSIAEFFRQRRASCILCTTGPIEDRFATRLARVFYDHLGDGMNVVTALLAARQKLLEEGHPMALQYTFIGNDNHRLV